MLVSSYDAIDTRSILVYRAITCILSLAGVTFLTLEEINSPSPEVSLPFSTSFTKTIISLLPILAKLLIRAIAD